LGIPLRGLRVAVTTPPPTWFGGIDYAFALDMAVELRNLGATVMEVSIDGFLSRDTFYIDYILKELRSFRPDVAMGLPNSGYLLLCCTGEAQNVFRDILQIPAILIWDHGALQVANLLEHIPRKAVVPGTNHLERMRTLLDHPLFVHYSPDRGHTAAMVRFGILPAGQVLSFTHFAFPAYTSPLLRKPRGMRQPCSRVAFAGNLYLEGAANTRYRENAVLAGMESRVLEARKKDITKSFWDLFTAQIAACDRPTRDKLGLNPDSPFFWKFLSDEIGLVGNTAARLDMLTGLRASCDFYGNFMEPQAAPELQKRYGLRVHGSLDCLTGLPWLYRHSDLIVDVVNAGYISGVSPKTPSCLACGGMMLVDYKEDFRGHIGDIADHIMYRSLDQLNAMVDAYLSNPEKRQAISREIQARVLRELTFAAFCVRALVAEPAWRQPVAR
jgi:Glycosyl transferases group 1